MPHNPTDGFVPTFDSGVVLADFVAEVTFTAPHRSSEAPWSSGFLIRRTGSNRFHAVMIHSSGSWSHYLRTGTPGDNDVVRRDSSSAINTRGTATNHVRVVAAGGSGWLFVNDTYLAELDLSGLMEPGSLMLLGAWFDEDETAGGVTPYQSFSVQPLGRVYGPTDGSIAHADDGFIDVHRVFTSLADGIIEARFYNPYSAQEGSWTSGFMFRQGVSEEFHAVLIDDSGYWYQRSRTGDLDSAQAVAEGRSSHIDTSPSGSNHIRIIASRKGGMAVRKRRASGQAGAGPSARGGVRVSRRLVLPWPRHPGQGDPVRRPHGSVGGTRASIRRGEHADSHANGDTDTDTKNRLHGRGDRNTDANQHASRVHSGRGAGDNTRAKPAHRGQGRHLHRQGPESMAGRHRGVHRPARPPRALGNDG